MRILISNDDGIQAKGLESLVKAFCARKHTVVVSAQRASRAAWPMH